MTVIGVFDSGVGGLSVANAVQKALPEAKVILRDDKENLPYGSKSAEQLLVLVEPILKDMVAEGCSVIVVACNTVTTNLISELRKRISVPLIGMEPMVKSAANLTKTGTIAVFATPATLSSKRYSCLKEEFAKDIEVIEPDCSSWAMMIEQNHINKNSIRLNVEQALNSQADVIVLGCTHYHWIEEEIIELINNKDVLVLQPEPSVIERLKTELARLL